MNDGILAVHSRSRRSLAKHATDLWYVSPDMKSFIAEAGVHEMTQVL